MLLAGVNLRVSATGYPGAALFTFQCISGAITFFYQGTAILQANLGQVASGLSVAKATGQNQLVVPSEPASLWVLVTDEMQIHLNSNPDATKLVISVNVCGSLSLVAAPVYGSAVAYAEVTGTGRAIAYAQVTPFGSVAYASATGTGQVVAGAATTGGPVGTTPSGQKTYTVQSGDTLYRIAVRFGTTVSVLASINGLSNPNMIQVGQVIYLP
jgi:nucleoid-associated protein YgaU